MNSLSSTLCFTGALLFCSACSPASVSRFRSPRIGLSADLAAIESGLGLIAFGLLLPQLAMSIGWAAAIGNVLWIALYVFWNGLLFAGIYGTVRRCRSLAAA